MERIQKTFRAMGTLNTIAVDRRADEGAVKMAVSRVLALNDRLSVFRDESEIYRLNVSAGRAFVPVGADTLTVLKAAKKYSALSGGAFSVTARPLTAAWRAAKARGTVPDTADLEKALALVNDEDLILDEPGSRAMLRRPGQAVDLGGIAKGYAADEARRILAENGVADAIVNFGGTVIVLGRPKTVGIQHPERGTGIPMGRLRVQNAAVVTSGSYERFSEVGKTRYHHIIDPATGYPSAANLESVTVIGESAMELDALSTALFVMGLEKGAQFSRRFPVEVIFVTDTRDVVCSTALGNRFSLDPIYANAR